MTSAARGTSRRTARDALRDEIADLSEPLAQEALDFVLFVKNRHAEEQFLWSKVEETQKDWREHPEEVMTVTAEELDRLTAHLEDEG
jgi:hypothetical protein